MNSGGNKFRYHVLEKKYGDMDLKSLYRIIKKSFFYLVIVYIPFAAIATITNRLVMKMINTPRSCYPDMLSAIMITRQRHSPSLAVIRLGPFTLILKASAPITSFVLPKKT